MHGDCGPTLDLDQPLAILASISERYRLQMLAGVPQWLAIHVVSARTMLSAVAHPSARHGPHIGAELFVRHRNQEQPA